MEAVSQLVQELLNASATVLGTAFLSGLLGALLLHRLGLLGRWTVRAITVTRDPATKAVDGQVPDTVGAVAPAWARKRGYVALSEYFEQLVVAEGDREQWAESALMALLIGTGFGAPAEAAAGLLLAALPIGALLPASLTQPVTHPLAAAAAEAAMEPLALAAAARIVGCPVDTAQPAELLTAGEPAGATPALGLTGKSVVRLPEDLRLAEAGAFAGVTAAAAAAAADTRYKSEEATPISATLLPDLCFGTGGMTSLFTPRQEFRNRYMAAILNRLAANRLHAGRGAAFAVVVGEASVTSAGELLRAIAKSKGTLDGRFQSQVASFGLNICIKEKGDEKLKPVAFALAMRTGVVDPDSGRNIAVPATHGSLALSLSLPDLSLGAVQFYAGTEGFTGWHPDGGWEAPWREGVTQHADPLNVDELVRAADVGTAFAIASARCVETHNLPCGGYGDVGICNDSTAVLQLCVRNVCTIGQTGGTGIGPQRLCHTALSLADTTASTPRKQRNREIAAHPSRGKCAQAIPAAHLSRVHLTNCLCHKTLRWTCAKWRRQCGGCRSTRWSVRPAPRTQRNGRSRTCSTRRWGCRCPGSRRRAPGCGGRRRAGCRLPSNIMFMFWPTVRLNCALVPQ